MAPARDGDDPTAGADAIVRAETSPTAQANATERLEVAGIPLIVERSPKPAGPAHAGRAQPGTRWDLALVSARLGTKVAPNGVRSLVRYLVASDVIVNPREEPGEVDGLTAIRAQPGSYAHSIFHPGPADPATTPAFHEAVIRFGAVPVPLAYGEAGPPSPVYFALELRGCAFDYVHQRLIDRLYQVLYLRAAVFARPLGEVEGPQAPGQRAERHPVARVHVGGVGTTVEEKE